MKILFISRSKGNGDISSVVKAQAKSLEKHADISFYIIRGQGIFSYFKAVWGIRKYMKKNKIDIVHAHYALCGFVASFSTSKSIVCSLMGSDIEDYWIGRILIRLFNALSWDDVIIKSQRLKEKIKLRKAHIIPNGINMDVFIPLGKATSRKRLGFSDDEKHVVFIADPERKEKKFSLAKQACDMAGKQIKLNLVVINNLPHTEIVYYLSAADALILTSHFEGSPNVIKEAMACNCPIVSTDVGDVKEVIGKTDGCYITTYEPEDVADKIKLALEFGRRTNGREKIHHLDEKVIAQKISDLYVSLINKPK